MKKYFCPTYDWMYEGPIFADSDTFKTLCWLAYKSCYEDTFVIVNNIKVNLKKGEVFLESRKKAAQALNLGETRYRNILRNLEEAGEIEVKSTNRYTIIKLIKWHHLEPKQPADNQHTTNKRPTYNRQTTDPYININNKNNINNSNLLNNCVPTPKATKFRNIEATNVPDFGIEWERENIRRQIEKYGSSD